MAFFPLVSFVALLLFGSVDSWAACTTQSNPYTIYSSVDFVAGDCESMGLYSLTSTCSAMASSVACNGLTFEKNGLFYTRFVYSSYFSYVNTGSSNRNCQQSDVCFYASASAFLACYSNYACNTKCEADSIACLQDPEATWDSQNCKCGAPLGPPPDSTFVCQNAGGPEPGGFGGPRVAKLFKCDENQVCTNTADLAGTCQDWGFCSEGVDHCFVPPDSAGNPPCGRSGSGMTSTTSCYYACADGKNLQCKPISTQYVAGSIYVGECPSSPPAGCYPTSSSSGGGGSSSSGGGSSSSSSYGSYSSSDGFVPPDTVVIPQGSQIDYTRILNAIKDTLHRANNQRDFIANLQVTANQSFNTIANYSQYGYSELEGINQKMSDVVTATSSTSAAADGINGTLTSLQDNGIKITGPVASAVENSNELLDELTKYLKGDSLVVNVPRDTAYNPILREIKDAIEQGQDDSTVADRIAAKIKDTTFITQGGPWSSIFDFFDGPSGSDSSYCEAFNACTASGAKDCFRQYPEWSERCLSGGSPFDTEINLVGSILDKLLEVFWGEDSTEVVVADTADTNYTPSPLQSSASAIADSANASINLSTLASMVDSVRALVDSAKKHVNDTAKIQPDSLWLDSAQAAQYVQNMLLPSGTVSECFVCRADLGNFGGLSDTTLKIYIDFANFGGFNFCEIIRVIVKIIATVTCVSLTLGSWAAAFGYNPKNDA